MGLQNCSL